MAVEPERHTDTPAAWTMSDVNMGADPVELAGEIEALLALWGDPGAGEIPPRYVT